MRKMFSSVPTNGKLMKELSSERNAVKLPWATATFSSDSVLGGKGGISSWRARRRQVVGETIARFGERGMTTRSKGEFGGGREDWLCKVLITSASMCAQNMLGHACIHRSKLVRMGYRQFLLRRAQ